MMQSMHSSSMGSETNNSDPDTKVMTDLDTLTEQITLCSEMLKEKHGKVDDSDEALLGVIGFLEACAPRMVELVEAAAQGELKESTLMKCLEINDRLLKVLSECDSEGGGEGDSATASAAVAGTGCGSAAAAAKNPLDLDLDDLLLDDATDGDYKTSSKIGAGKFQSDAPTGPLKSDPFGGTTDLLVPTPSSTSIMKDDLLTDSKPPASAAPASAIDDEFDAFLRDRSGKTD
mmetsp:Transcript_12645/g.15949  ORF Transcript_12645/g.15949 Transcript_12645/m.15949 type:complete len:232 (+) Transcript_12645:159-854(+)|eukprot:CAMPEP_0172496290 /NCGR_PEP_ID=MMETSP1066-20121228/84838_1 /TAXON_ID=671091 /ORGANISM="Coscinodiscus wailesii, Strain CCMP2513" /LENGTH=231 /DNA_ID=CAMNT_0013268505 /DNA_START=136 /DNA_END=831 /DNA_ORIENTATION=-